MQAWKALDEVFYIDKYGTYEAVGEGHRSK